MKARIVSLFALVALPLALANCSRKLYEISSKENLVYTHDGIYDDDVSSVFFTSSPGGDSDDRVAGCLIKKRQWESRSPNKRVVSISYVDGAGLIVQYEARQQCPCVSALAKPTPTPERFKALTR